MEDRMKEEEDENSWFGMLERMSVYTTPCNLNFYYNKLHYFKILLHRIILYFYQWIIEF